MSLENFDNLTQIVKALLHPETGCPWDLKQTHESLLKFLMEESYEFMDAVKEKDIPSMEDEIGDVLLQVLLHCEIASKKDHFNIESVAKNLSEKMIRRHPHVFSDTKVSGEEEVKDNWEKIKQAEKGTNKSKEDYRITKKTNQFPSLLSSYKIGKKTERLNFDWDDYSQVMYKVEEEWQELKEELAPGSHINQERVAEEMGDFLFSAAQLARHLGLEPEETLRQANAKFIKRFNKMEDKIKNSGNLIDNLSQKEMDVYWDEVKRDEL